MSPLRAASSIAVRLVNYDKLCFKLKSCLGPSFCRAGCPSSRRIYSIYANIVYRSLRSASTDLFCRQELRNCPDWREQFLSEKNGDPARKANRGWVGNGLSALEPWIGAWRLRPKYASPLSILRGHFEIDEQNTVVSSSNRPVLISCQVQTRRQDRRSAIRNAMQ